MKTSSRVFVVQDMGFDYSDAELSFGELIILLDRKEANVSNVLRATALIKKRLWDGGFRSEDYLLAIGSPVLIMLAGIEASRIAPHGFGILQWDRKEQKYFNHSIRRT